MQNSRHKFRKAELDDLEQIVDLLRDLEAKAWSAYGIQAEGHSLVEMAMRTINHGVCLVGKGAVAGGYLVKFPANQRVLVGNVLFWNFTQPSGLKILEAIAAQFKALGATYLSVTSHYPENRIGDFYCKTGLQRVETNWLAKIDQMNFSIHKQKSP